CDKKSVTLTVDMNRAKRMWIHCNWCFVHFVDRENIIFVLACNHMICDKCVVAQMGRSPVDAATYTCPICKKLVRARQVSNSLPRNIKDMLHPEPWHATNMSREVNDFQKAHQRSLELEITKKVKCDRILLTKNENNETVSQEREMIKLDKDIALAKKIITKQYSNYHQLRTERRQFQLHVQKVQRQAQLRKQEARQRLVCYR
ncbi:hypothetical protein KR044_008094, partial [Drosophila immigrans]